MQNSKTRFLIRSIARNFVMLLLVAFSPAFIMAGTDVPDIIIESRQPDGSLTLTPHYQEFTVGSGIWSNSVGKSSYLQFIGTGSRWCGNNSVGNYAVFRPTIVTTGTYDLYITVPALNSFNSPGASYSVTGISGPPVNGTFNLSYNTPNMSNLLYRIASQISMSPADNAEICITNNNGASNDSNGRFCMDGVLLRYAPVTDPWDNLDDNAANATILNPTPEAQYHGAHMLSPFDHTDWYQIPMEAGREYTFQAAEGYNLFLELFSNPSGSPLLNTSMENQIVYVSPASQNYYIKVTSLNNTDYMPYYLLYYRDADPLTLPDFVTKSTAFFLQPSNYNSDLDTITPGQIVYPGFFFRLSGSASSYNIPFRLYLDGQLIADDTFQNLAPDSYSGTVGAWTATTGTHTLRVVLDPEQTISESLEDNNEIERTFEIGLPARPDPQVLQQYGLGTKTSAHFALNGKHFLTLSDSHAYLWDLDSGVVIRRFPSEADSFGAISADGSKVALCGPAGARLFDSATGISTAAFLTNEKLYCAAFSPDGLTLACGTDSGWLYTFDTRTHTQKFAISISANPVTAVTYSLNGQRMAVGSDPFGVRILTSTGTTLSNFNSIYAYTYALSLSPDGNYFIASANGTRTSQMINSLTGAVIWSITIDAVHPLQNAQFSPDGLRVILNARNATRVVSASNGGLVRSITGHQGIVNCVGYLPDNLRVFTSSPTQLFAPGDNTSKLWDVSSGNILKEYIGHTPWVTGLEHSQNSNHVYSAGGGMSIDNTIYEWDASSGELIRGFRSSGNDISAIAVSSDDSMVVSCEMGILRTWNTITGYSSYPLVHDSAETVAISPDKTLVASGGDSSAKLWNIQTGQVRATLPHKGKVTGLEFLSDNRLLTCQDDNVRCWSPTGQLLSTVELGYDAETLKVTPDSSRYITASNNGMYEERSTASGACLHQYITNANGLVDLNISADGTKLAVVHQSSSGNNVFVWNRNSHEQLLKFRDPYAFSICISPDGTRILVGGSDGITRGYEIAPPKAIIVSGGGPFLGNSIAQQTDDLGAYAYKTLRARGFSNESIFYLSAFNNRDADSDGIMDVDAPATLESLQQAITGEFSSSAGRLMLLMIDHGYRTDGFMAFRINPTQAISSVRLNDWLNQLQSTHEVDVTMVVDCCYSGQLVSDCSNAPAGRKRIVIASTTSTAEAVFLPPPDLTSFMQSFLSSAYMGNSLGQAWRAAATFFDTFKVANQVPQISDGSGNSAIADREFFGASWAYGVQRTLDINQFFPVFETNSWTSALTIAPTDPVNVSIRTIPGRDPISVSIAIRPPAPSVLSGDPVTTLPRVSLSRDPADSNRWTAVIPANSIFAQTGNYSLSYVAVMPNARVTNPVFGSIAVNVGLDPDTTPIRAILAIGNAEDPISNAALSDQGPLAYRSLLDRFQSSDGIKHPDWINYFTAHADVTKDGDASTAAILNSISTIANDISGACRLFIHLIGTSDGVPGRVRLTNGDFITATQLKSALDSWQAASPANRIAIVSVDSPGSGAFLPLLANSLYQRVTITSGRTSDGAIYLPFPILTSFSQKYLSSAAQGNNIYSSFTAARNFFLSFLRYYLTTPIRPLLDDNGDGIASAADGILASSMYVGRRYAFAGDEAAGLPFILQTDPERIVVKGSSVHWSATLLETPGVNPQRVFVQLVPPSGLENNEVTNNLNEHTLTRDTPAGWTWSGNFIAPEVPGTYSVNVYASYPDGDTVKMSEPSISALIVNENASAQDWSLYY